MNTMKVGCGVGAKHKICVMYTDAAAPPDPGLMYYCQSPAIHTLTPSRYDIRSSNTGAGVGIVPLVDLLCLAKIIYLICNLRQKLVFHV